MDLLDITLGSRNTRSSICTVHGKINYMTNSVSLLYKALMGDTKRLNRRSGAELSFLPEAERFLSVWVNLFASVVCLLFRP